MSTDEKLGDIATLLYAYWHHPAASTRAQIEAFIARHCDVTVTQLRTVWEEKHKPSAQVRRRSEGGYTDSGNMDYPPA